MKSLQDIAEILYRAVGIIGPERNGPIEFVLYEFLRRYGPMACADVVLVPEDREPSALLAKRDNKAVAPKTWWIFGGRIDKKLDYIGTAQEKIQSEIGLDVSISLDDLIGLGKTYFPPDKQEEKKRDYDVSTQNICFAKQIPWTAKVQKKLKPADGHLLWRRFTTIDPKWHPYIVHTVAHAWHRFYGKDGLIGLDKETRKVLRDKSSFIPLRYSPLEF